MRLPQESAITRRDDNLARISKLSAWIAGGAIAASLGLATALRSALPGHAHSAPASHAGSSAGQRGGTGGGQGGGTSSGTNGNNSGITPPQQPPSGSVAPPMTTSSGS